MNFLRFSGSSTVGDVLGRDGGAADHEEVDARLLDDARELRRGLRRQRPGDRDAGVADLVHPLR